MCCYSASGASPWRKVRSETWCNGLIKDIRNFYPMPKKISPTRFFSKSLAKTCFYDKMFKFLKPELHTGSGFILPDPVFRINGFSINFLPTAKYFV